MSRNRKRKQQTLSLFFRDHPQDEIVFHVGTKAMGGWIMVGTHKERVTKENKRGNAERFFTRHMAEPRKEAIIQAVREDRLLDAASKIKALMKTIRNNEKTLRAIPKYSEWKNRLVLDCYQMLRPGHVAIIVEGKERGKYWDQEEYQNETPMEDKEE